MNNKYRSTVVNGVVVNVFGEQDLISDHIMSFNIFWENHIFDKWKQYFPDTGLMIDLGANIGNHCLMFHSNFPELDIMAFEMTFDNFDLLKINIEPYPQITAFNVAVSDSVKIIKYDNSFNHNNGEIRIKNQGAYSNVAITLDSLNIEEPVSFIKIDIEGHELQAFYGMENTLLKNKPVIWTEDFVKSGCSSEGQSFVDLLLSLGYEIVDSIESDFLLKYKE
jgi:FkbM family methyltransferase